MLPPEIVIYVQSEKRRAFAKNSLPNHFWRYQAQDPTKIELIPKGQYQASGAVQNTLHPNRQGGFKQLGSNC